MASASSAPRYKLPPEGRMHLAGYGGGRPLPAAGDAERWASAIRPVGTMRR
jgi:hypothetical protein